MLLRFERGFNLRYIQKNFRHETFQPLTYQEAWRFIQQQTTNYHHRHELLTILQSRSPNDAYYRVNYRDGDTNVGLRLRSWRPKGEVIFSWELRQNLAQEVAEEARLYLN